MMEYLFDARLIFRNLHMFGSVYSISESAYNLVQFGAVASASVDTNYISILLHNPDTSSNPNHASVLYRSVPLL
jgi:hypothetical protein